MFDVKHQYVIFIVTQLCTTAAPLSKCRLPDPVTSQSEMTGGSVNRRPTSGNGQSVLGRGDLTTAYCQEYLPNKGDPRQHPTTFVRLPTKAKEH